jgi:predicted Zn-dependent protease
MLREKLGSPSWLAIAAAIMSFFLTMVTLGNFLFASKNDTVTKAEAQMQNDKTEAATQIQIDKLEKRNGETIADLAARLARLEQIHGPGGHP